MMKIMSSEPNPIDSYVGHRLRDRRALLGISQEALAETLGVTFQQVQKYERGTNRIGSSRLYLLAQALQVPITYFFEGLDGVCLSSSSPGNTGPALSTVEVATAVADAHAEPVVDSRETLELVRAFNRLSDPLVRRRLYELTRALADLEYQKTSQTSQRP